jgi:predicted alpha/beta hydrolase
MNVAERFVEGRGSWRLSVIDLCPPEPWGVAILGHAMMVDRRTLYRGDRPSLAGTLAEEGMRVLVADLRGHGKSGPRAQEGGSWTYDDLVADVEVYLALARELEPGLPVALLGNSLFGHVALCHLGMHPDEPVAALVGFAINIWNERWTASRARWWLKRALVGASAPIVSRQGRLPARRLGLGSDDEPLAYWQSMLRWVPGNRWDADDGSDYAALLARVAPPALVVVSEGDRLLAQPDDALLFTAPLEREVLRLGSACSAPRLRGMAPGHVEMVASPRMLPLWRHVASWVKSCARA